MPCHPLLVINQFLRYLIKLSIQFLKNTKKIEKYIFPKKNRGQKDLKLLKIKKCINKNNKIYVSLLQRQINIYLTFMHF